MDRNTIFFNMDVDKPVQKSVLDILNTVSAALEEKGYNATDQLVGYILSGDPTYITSHNNARNIIKHMERDEIVEELLRAYLNGGIK